MHIKLAIRCDESIMYLSTRGMAMKRTYNVTAEWAYYNGIRYLVHSTHDTYAQVMKYLDKCKGMASFVSATIT